MTIYERLRVLDARKIISIKEISDATNIHERTISNWFSGSVKAIPHILFTYLAKEKPQVNLEWLLLEKGEPIITISNKYPPPTAGNAETVNEPMNNKDRETINALAKIIEKLTMQINELPSLRERIIELEKEMEAIKKKGIP